MRDVCREHVRSITSMLEASPSERQVTVTPSWTKRRGRIALERALGRKTYDLEVAGKLLRDWE